MKSIVTKLQKDAGKCYDNAKKLETDIVTHLSKGNTLVKGTKGNKDTFKWLREGSWKSTEREKKVNGQVAKGWWTGLHH